MRLLAILAGLCLLALGLTGPAAEKKAHRTLGTIERKDPAFDKLIAPDAVLEVLADGFIWSEGPVWVPRDGGYLLFSDIPRNSIMKWQEGKGISLYLRPSGYNGDR